MKKTRRLRTGCWIPAALGLLLALPVAQAQAASGDAAAGEATFDQAASKAQADLEESLHDLAALREQIAAEKLPLNRTLTELQTRLSSKRRELDEAKRSLDTESLDLNTLRAQVEAHRQENDYLSNLLDEYVRNFESRVHIAELQRYRTLLDQARLAPEKGDMPPAQVYAAQTKLTEASLDRLDDLLGGAKFPGQAVGESGVLQDVEFLLLGPVALYRVANGGAGFAEQRLGSLEPRMIPLEEPEQVAEVAALIDSGSGTLPFDPSLGNARKIADTEDSLRDQLIEGGPVMIPIVALAAAALLVALLKLVQISRVRVPSIRKVRSLLDSVSQRDYAAAATQVDAIPGPSGAMLRAGMEHIHQTKELVEEVMFERMLETRLRLQSFLPFVALAASAAPLLGLLGTVTGMINTFKLITVFGSGDANTLSSGISEALLTTKFGLVVAIPSLLLYAYLSRRARGLVDGMEKLAVSLLNRISSAAQPTGAAPGRARAAAEVAS